MSGNLSATQIAIIAAVVLVAADSIALIAALKAYEEEQQSAASTKLDIQNRIKYLQEQLNSRYPAKKHFL